MLLKSVNTSDGSIHESQLQSSRVRGAVAKQCVQKYLNLFHLEMQGIIVSCPPLAWCAAPACSFTPIHH